jgi:hypothetical protein
MCNVPPISQMVGPVSVASWTATANGSWNKQAEVPLEKWLLQKPSPADGKRLHALGNIVIPQCADLAMQVIASMTCAPAGSARR